MSRAVQREYRIRFAIRGANEIGESTVDFVLEIDALAGVPVVAGSIVHPLSGATEMRPIQVDAIDRDGALIAALTADGRWAALGRVVDVQYRDADESAEWVTYGTGRCSGISEADGPGRFRIEISDESWVARQARLFRTADTTQLWPMGIRWPWRGFAAGAPADITRDAQDGDHYRLHLEYAGPSTEIGKEVTEALVRWINGDRVPANTPADAKVGNYQHTRVWHQDDTGTWRAWPIVAFSQSHTNDPTEQSLQEADGEFHVWVLKGDSSWGAPAASGQGYVFAPTAPPSSDLPLHLGVGSSEHPYGNDAIDPDAGFAPGGVPGYLHIADLTRRVWNELGVRYDPDNLDALEQDLSFPALAPMITEEIDDPHRWLEEEVWGPSMLCAVRDSRGRMRLADLRPPPEESDLSHLPVLDAGNSRSHRWRLDGNELVNRVVWEYDAMQVPPFTINREAVIFLREGIHGSGIFHTEALGLPVIWTLSDVADSGPIGFDLIERKPATIGPLESEDAEIIGPRERRLRGHAMMDPTGSPFLPDIVNRNASAAFSLRGSLWHEKALGDVTYFLFSVFQDGAYRGTCEVAGSVAETLAEGDYVLIDCASLKLPNPGAAARAGGMLALLLSLTRHPAHAECEYLVIRPENIFRCPEPDLANTWLATTPGENATIRIALRGFAPPNGEAVALRIRARKDVAGGEQVDLGVTLYEGETEIAAWLETDISEDWTVYVLELTNTQANSVGDWNALAVEISRAGQAGGAEGQARALQISQIAA